MSGFDSYRVRERADIARWVLVGAFLVLSARSSAPRSSSTTSSSSRPRPTGSGRSRSRRPRGHPRPARPDHRRERARLFGQAAGVQPRLAARRAGPGGPLRPARHSETAEIVRRYARPATSRRGVRRRHVRDHRPAGGAPRGAARAGDPVRAQAAVSGGQGGGSPGGLRLRGHRIGPQRQPVPRRGLGSIVGKAGLEREYDDTLRGAEGVRYIEVNARGRLVREEASNATLPPTPGQPIVPRSTSTSSASSTASGRRASGARWWR